MTKFKWKKKRKKGKEARRIFKRIKNTWSICGMIFIHSLSKVKVSVRRAVFGSRIGILYKVFSEASRTSNNKENIKIKYVSSLETMDVEYRSKVKKTVIGILYFGFMKTGSNETRNKAKNNEVVVLARLKECPTKKEEFKVTKTKLAESSSLFLGKSWIYL